MQVTVFHATSKSRTVSKEVGRVTEGAIEPGQSFSWEGQQFVLPPLPPSYLVGCRIIDVRYILQVSRRHPRQLHPASASSSSTSGTSCR